jgi:hypothetical protein
MNEVLLNLLDEFDLVVKERDQLRREWIVGARKVVGNDKASVSGQIAFIALDEMERLQAQAITKQLEIEQLQQLKISNQILIERMQETIDNAIDNEQVYEIRIASFDQVKKVMEAEIKESNDLLRSAWMIAKRDGKDTNWEAFRGQLNIALERQHKMMYPKDEEVTK